MRKAAFAIPGDINTVTGGYIYERRLLEGLRAQGRDVAHLELPASFPMPAATDMALAIEALANLPPDRALILDGLVFGAIDTAGLARVRAPLVAMIHHPLALETGLDGTTRNHLFRTERDNLRLTAHVLVPSQHTAGILASRYGVDPGKITVAPPGTDTRPRTRRPRHPPLIFSVGLLHPRKGHDVLLHALAKIVTQDWRCVIAGSAHDPAHASELAGLVDSLCLTERVTLAGRVLDAERDALYAEASIFALATRYEGYGMVFDEALSWGLPIVSCATGAVPMTVPEGAGLLVPMDAPDTFSAALERLLTDTGLRNRMADRAATVGGTLPGWANTARIAGDALDAL